MTPLYLRYKNAALDPWTEVPDLTAVFPSQALGSLPLGEMRMATEPAIQSTCGCSDPTAADDAYVLHSVAAPIPQSVSLGVIDFLLAYKTASFHEAKQTRYAGGSYVTAELNNLVISEEDGSTWIRFRVVKV